MKKKKALDGMSFFAVKYPTPIRNGIDVTILAAEIICAYKTLSRMDFDLEFSLVDRYKFDTGSIALASSDVIAMAIDTGDIINGDEFFR